MNINFPFQFDHRGRTAETDYSEHVRDMIELTLLTNPGERVNRPEFGSALLQSLFAPNSDSLAAALQFATRASLQQSLGDVIELESLEVNNDDATLLVSVVYVLRRTGERVTAIVERPAAL